MLWDRDPAGKRTFADSLRISCLRLRMNDSPRRWTPPPAKERRKQDDIALFSPSGVIMSTYLLEPVVIGHLLCCIPSIFTAKQDKRRNGALKKRHSTAPMNGHCHQQKLTVQSIVLCCLHEDGRWKHSRPFCRTLETGYTQWAMSHKTNRRPETLLTPLCIL